MACIILNGYWYKHEKHQGIIQDNIVNIDRHEYESREANKVIMDDIEGAYFQKTIDAFVDNVFDY